MYQKIYIDYNKLSREELIKELEVRDNLINKLLEGVFKGLDTCRELILTLNKLKNVSFFKSWIALWIGYYHGKYSK